MKMGARVRGISGKGVKKMKVREASGKGSKKMKILMLNYEFPPLGGGAANATYYLLKEFSKVKNLEIDLVTSSTDEFRVEQFAPNIKIHFLDIGKNGELHYQSNKDLLKYSYNAYKYSKGLMKKKRFGLCHAFFGIPCGYIAMKIGLPYIVSLRGSDVPYWNPKFKLLDNFLFSWLSPKIWEKSKATIANSKKMKIKALESSTNQKIEVIYNGIDTNMFKPIKEKEKDILDILLVGRLSKIKNFDLMINALEDVPFNYKLHIVGDGPEKEILEALANKNKIKCKFYGMVEDKKKLIKIYQGASIYCTTSLNEGMSNTMLEAMSCGLPIITTNVGGAKELIKENGFIIRVGDSKELLKKIKTLAGDKRMRNNMGKKSRLITEKMSWENMAKSYLGVYRE
jgi:glycosyltransferase involved in cell wall biosynthesis